MIANLELMPLRMNESKNDKIGARQLDLAKKLHSAGLLSAEGKQKIDSHPQHQPRTNANQANNWRRPVAFRVSPPARSCADESSQPRQPLNSYRLLSL